MTIKYPKLHNRVFSVVTMGFLTISGLAYSQELGQNDCGQELCQNDCGQENVESQKNDLSFKDPFKIITQQESLTLDEYNEILSTLDEFPEDIRDFLQSEQHNLSDKECFNQFINLIKEEKDLSNQQLIQLFRIVKFRIDVSTVNKDVKEHKKIQFPNFGFSFWGNIYPSLQDFEREQQIKEQEAIKKAMERIKIPEHDKRYDDGIVIFQW